MLVTGCTKNTGANEMVERCSTAGRVRAALATLAFILTLGVATQASASRCIVDVGGVDDGAAHKDVTQFCWGMGSGSPFELHITGSLDRAAMTADDVADVCFLFDSNRNSRVDLALCTTVLGAPAVLNDVRLLTCDDSRSDRCNGAVQINVCDAGGNSCLSDSHCGANDYCPKQYETVCNASREATDPFAKGAGSPWDTVVSCAVDLDEFGVDGATARLINVGSYASSASYSETLDTVLPPACASDADCGNGQACHLPSGECTSR